jgi:hypothetical protein
MVTLMTTDKGANFGWLHPHARLRRRRRRRRRSGCVFNDTREGRRTVIGMQGTEKERER